MSTATTTDSADFYALEAVLDDNEQEFLHRVRDFMKTEVEPSVNRHWQLRMRETVGYARELLGGNGILLEHNVGRFVADAEAIYSYEGTREMNTLIVGRAITGLSAFV